MYIDRQYKFKKQTPVDSWFATAKHPDTYFLVKARFANSALALQAADQPNIALHRRPDAAQTYGEWAHH
jgi:hypothetical protein